MWRVYMCVTCDVPVRQLTFEFNFTRFVLHCTVKHLKLKYSRLPRRASRFRLPGNQVKPDHQFITTGSCKVSRKIASLAVCAGLGQPDLVSSELPRGSGSCHSAHVHRTIHAHMVHTSISRAKSLVCKQRPYYHHNHQTLRCSLPLS